MDGGLQTYADAVVTRRDASRTVQEIQPAFRRIGFMQGRLSPLIDGKIQAFPWDCWKEEFALAGAYGFPLLEWTLDFDRLAHNPLVTPTGQHEIERLKSEHGVRVVAVTCDCFKQVPFYKADGSLRERLVDEVRRVIESCIVVGAGSLMIPLVDEGRLESAAQRTVLEGTLNALVQSYGRDAPLVVFESDLPPAEFASLIDGFPADRFGITFDIGDRASCGFDPAEEFAAFGSRIRNVHVKDRPQGGTTVPLGTGNADFTTVFRLLKAAGYDGNYILQAARAADGDHLGTLLRYRDMVAGWLHG